VTLSDSKLSSRTIKHSRITEEQNLIRGCSHNCSVLVVPYAFEALVASSQVDSLPHVHTEASAANEESGRIETAGAASTCMLQGACVWPVQLLSDCGNVTRDVKITANNIRFILLAALLEKNMQGSCQSHDIFTLSQSLRALRDYHNETCSRLAIKEGR
jgi:hypothetical protein